MTLIGTNLSANAGDPGSSVILNFTTSPLSDEELIKAVTTTCSLEDEEVITDLSKDEVIDKEDKEVISKVKAAVSKDDEPVPDSISGLVL